jgi:hypothetical protein
MKKTQTQYTMQDTPEHIKGLIEHLFPNPIPDTSVVTIHRLGDQLLEIEVGAYAVQFSYTTTSQKTAA